MSLVTICLFASLCGVICWLAWGSLASIKLSRRRVSESVDDTADMLFESWGSKD